MVNMKVDKRELDKLVKTLKGLDAKLRKSVLTSGLRTGAKHIQGLAKEKVPVRTGRLRDAIVIRKKLKKYVRKSGFDPDTSVVYEVGIEQNSLAKAYAKKIEYGAKNQSAQPYMRPAMNEGFDKVNREVYTGIKRRLKRLVK